MMIGLASLGAPRVRASIESTRIGSCNAAGGTCEAVSNVATATVAGRGGYTYLWENVSGDVFAIDTDDAATTTFSKTNAVAGSPSFEGVYKCTVTDSVGKVGVSNNVTVTLNFVDST